jgi:predicted Zn-ribbon and HTH transcriptional regulator
MMTIRREIMGLLSRGEWTAGELSRAVRIPQKEVYVHLEHIMRSLRSDFSMVPAVCLACGFAFTKRKAVKSPSRCPLCKSEHIKDPAYYCNKERSDKENKMKREGENTG